MIKKRIGAKGVRAKGRRTPKELARDRAINRAIADAGSRDGPIIVRMGGRPVHSSASNQPEARNSSALADALQAAGIKLEPKKEVALQKPIRPKSRKAKFEKQKQATPQKKTVKKQSPPPKKQTSAKPRKSAADIDAERKAKREKKFLAALRKKAAEMQGDQTPGELRWQQRQQEIADLIDNIRRAPFSRLASEWKKHVGLAGYIEETGRNAERLDSYVQLIATIEREWGRRSKLSFNSDEYFDWPSTRAAKSKNGIGTVNWTTERFLSYLGYHVGESSELTDHARRAILRRTFKMVLPPLESPDYVKSWGAPTSPARLKKMAYSLASFARSAKRRSASNFATAIAEWEADLAMLREEFYVAKFGFGWPSIGD